MTHHSSRIVLALTVCLALAGLAPAAIVESGTNSGYPNDSTRWYIGLNGQGSLEINGGSTLTRTEDSQNTFIATGTGSGGSSITVTGTGSTFNHATSLLIGYNNSGSLTVSAGGTLNTNNDTTLTGLSQNTAIGTNAGGVGSATVTGSGSVWTDSSVELRIGYLDEGTLSVSDGGKFVSTNQAAVGHSTGGGQATVTGTGSIWKIDNLLGLDRNDDSPTATLTIEDGGLVQAKDANFYGDNGVIRMQTGGMLALEGTASDLSEFTALFTGTYDTGDIQYYTGSAWDDIENATAGADYTVSAGTGDLAGYSVLTVPEPTTLGLLALGGLAILRRRSRK